MRRRRMILTRGEIGVLGIVHNGSVAAQQDSTYNATVNEILAEGEVVSASEYRLPKRGVVWVVSKEEFELPDDVTGMATLKTTWTHDGILALNVGIVDPGWHGPLAAALVNFSDKPFVIKKGAQFLRVAFHRHKHTSAQKTWMDMEGYVGFIRDKSARTSSTFLDIKSLGDEVVNEVFTIPRWVATLTKWGVAFAVVSMLVALLAIFVPIAWSIIEGASTTSSKVEQLEKDVDQLKQDLGKKIEREGDTGDTAHRAEGSEGNQAEVK
jgi:deoxycytidine triphosphate deaminase